MASPDPDTKLLVSIPLLRPGVSGFYASRRGAVKFAVHFYREERRHSGLRRHGAGVRRHVMNVCKLAPRPRGPHHMRSSARFPPRSRDPRPAEGEQFCTSKLRPLAPPRCP